MSTFTADLTFGPYQAGFELDGGWNQRTIKYTGGAAPSVLTNLKAYTATMAIYDESDLTTMWQDRAGTTTQAVVGQPLGKMLNIKNGATALHMTAVASDARRPILTNGGL